MRKFSIIFMAMLLCAGLTFWLFKPEQTTAPYLPIQRELVPEEGYEREEGQPHLAALQNFEMTKDPALGYPPVERKLAAFQLIQEQNRNRPVANSAIPGISWVERGPDNIGGRTRTLMFDPNDAEHKKVWAGAIGGGLWFNMDITDEEQAWQQAPEIMTNLAISTVTYDPTNITHFYLGTGLGFTSDIRGEGIWKSTDAGLTWTQLESTRIAAFQFVQKIQVTANGTVLAATLSGVQRSVDGGETWTVTETGRIADIEIASNGVIYASKGVNSTGSVHKSTDDGVTWTEITPQTGGRRVEIAVAPSNPDFIYAVAAGGSGRQDVGWFQRSEDGGDNWEEVTIPPTFSSGCQPTSDHFTRGQAFFDLILAVHPNDPETVIVGGIDLHKSTNAGRNWNPISYWLGNNCDDWVHADQHEIQFRPGHPDQAVFGNDGGVDFSFDVGSAGNPQFSPRNKGYNTVLYYAISMANEVGSNLMIAGTQDNGTHRFTQAGINSIKEVIGGDGAFCFIDQEDPDIQIGSFVFNSYYLSTNGGKSFRNIVFDQGSGRFINPAAYDSQTGILFSAGNNNEIKRITGIKNNNPSAQQTLDVGASGEQISTIRISPHTANRLFFGTGSGNVYQLNNNTSDNLLATRIGSNFPGNPGQFVSSIDVGETDDHILVTFSNYGVNSVYETLDGGTTWASKEGNLPDIPVRWGLFNPDNTAQVLLATELGVWSTTDFNSEDPEWEASNSGLASARTDMLRYRAADKLVVAATHGRGAFTSNIFSNTPNADFRADRLVGYVGSPVTFLDASAAADDFAWDFGDGGTSNERNPEHTYEATGTYDVSLSINNGTVTETKVAHITILPKRPFPYTASDGGDFESNPDDFTSAALLHDVNVWERGTPGGTLNQPSSGTTAWKTGLNTNLNNLGFDHLSALFTPAFDLSDMNQDYTLSFRRSADTENCNGPIGLFVEYSTDGGLTWQVLGANADRIGSVNWYNRRDDLGCSLEREFNGDKVGWTSENGEPENNIETKFRLNELRGFSTVSFRIVAGVLGGQSGGYNQDGFMIDDFELLTTPTGANFEAERTLDVPGNAIQFFYTSTGADSFLWDFGDNTTSTEENPRHIYQEGGLYDVSLTVMVDGEEFSLTRQEYIKIISEITPPYLLANGGDFESSINDFSTTNSGGTRFELGSSEIPGKQGTTSGNAAWVTGLEDETYLNNTRSSLITPIFDLSQELEYEFNFKANYSFEEGVDGFIVEYSIDLGRNWLKVNNRVEDGWYNTESDVETIFGDNVPIFSGNTESKFEAYNTDVSFLFPNEAVMFRFLVLSDGEDNEAGVAIDDFELTAQTPVPPNADFEASSTGGCIGHRVTFTNTTTGKAEDYAWNFGENAMPQTASGEGPHTVIYSTEGIATVSLTATNAFGTSDTESKTDFIRTSGFHTPSVRIENTSLPDTKRLVASDGEAYQWFFENQEIDGATEQSLLVTEDGNYSVAVTVNGCAARASIFDVVTDIEENNLLEATTQLYPNPVNDQLTISITNEVMGQHQFNFISISGAKVRSESRLKASTREDFEFQLGSLGKGTYLVEIISPKGRSVQKFVKQ